MSGRESEKPLWIPHERWASTRRGRIELAAAAVFVLANAVLPFIVTDIYPITSTGMFRDSPVRMCSYEVYAPDGRKLEPDDFSVQMNYQANPPHVGFGYEPPPTVGEVDDVKSEAEVADWVRVRLRRFPQLQYVEVVQSVAGRIDGARVGVVQQNRWRIYNDGASHAP
ncbi:MAG: hypothetical protein JWL69_4531 [Phycisphaerales bacterium]|nr:hypothetical protein [Phycisphaerales bacterium]MDB5354373.1 hypothetical protein [Phycisphaerales bacterium]